MLSGSLPLPTTRSYPPVIPVRFAASPHGWRTQDELAEFLGLSRNGLNGFQRQRGGSRLYGPRYTRKATPAVPAHVYSDTAVADWLRTMKMTERDLWNFYQHKHPSEALKSEAKASIDSMLAAERLLKQ